MSITVESVTPRLREALLRTYFRNRPDGFPNSQADEQELEDHLTRRPWESESVVLPWVAAKVDLKDAVVVEIGCGTGSSTASFARDAGFVHGYDIVERCVEAANARLEVLGIENATCRAAPPEALLAEIERRHADGVDVALLYAVLEHQTVEERLESLETVWRLLRPGGHLIVTDSPNRLCYKHYHTSEVPFFDMLPEPLVWREIERSDRERFKETMREALETSTDRARDVLTRYGTGISHHEFEAALGPLEDLVVGDGFDPELASHKPLVLEEELLLSYLVMSGSRVPLGFGRVSIDVILRKPDGSARPRFESEGQQHAERIRRRMSQPGDTAPEELPTRLDIDWARRVADESLNGRMLTALALRKLWRKATRRSRP